MPVPATAEIVTLARTDVLVRRDGLGVVVVPTEQDGRVGRSKGEESATVVVGIVVTPTLLGTDGPDAGKRARNQILRFSAATLVNVLPPSRL